MARITVEDCLKAGYNKFALVHLAGKRVSQLKRGEEPLVSTSNRDIVAALREIAAGKVRMKQADDLPGDDLENESEGPDTEDDVDPSQSEGPLDETR